MALREVLAEFGIKIDEKALENADKSIAGLIGNVKALGGAFAGAAIVGGITNFIGSTLEASDAISDQAAQLGVATESLQLWQQVAKQAGADTAAVGVSMKTLAKNIDAAAEGNAEATKTFKDLGISVKDAEGNTGSLEDLFESAGNQIASIEDESKRAATALKVFGKQGLALIPAFKDGPEAVAKLKETLKESGGLIDDDTLEKIGKAGDALDTFSFAGQGLRARIVATIVPALTWLVEKATKLMNWFEKLVSGTSLFETSLTALGIALGVLAATFAPVVWGMVAPFLPLIAAIAAAVLIVDDLITLFKGGDSAIGRFIDSVWGAGTAAKVVEVVKEKFGKLFEFVKQVIGDMSAWWAQHGEAVKATFLDIWNVIASVIKLIVDAVLYMFTGWGTHLDLFAEAWDIFWSGIADSAKAVIDSIAEWFAGLWRGVEDGFNVALEKVKALNPANWFSNGSTNAGAAPGAPTAPSGGRGGVNVGASAVNVVVQGNATPETARLIGKTAAGALGDNRRATLAALTQRA